MPVGVVGSEPLPPLGSVAVIGVVGVAPLGV